MKTFLQDKFGLTDAEVSLFSWDETESRVVYVVNDGYGKPKFILKRSYSGQLPKALTVGEKVYHTIGEPSDTVVIVEDIISAIKVARYQKAFPLFGSNIQRNLYHDLLAHNRNVIVWLDHDKRLEAIKLANQLRNRGCRTTVIITKDDPKDLHDRDIKTKITDAVSSITNNNHSTDYL